MVEFSRGSEWRRWDLHVHTPETKKNDKYKGSSIEEKWDNFYDKISSYIGDGSDPMKNIAVIAITDYLSIDNYLKVKKDNRLPKSVKLVLPNIEMRLSSMAKNSPVNIHFIFNPEIVDELNERFFSKLKFDTGNGTYSATKEGLILLGKNISIEDIKNDQAYKLGLEKFLVNITDLKKLLDDDSILRENSIIIVSNSGNDGVSGIVLNDAQNDALRQSVYKLADMIFSPKESDKKYFLGQKNNDSVDKVIHDCGSLKPCVHGCDAHELDRLFEPVQRRYCWIKADPTFNGLKQVIYEPEARVRISAIMPETKASYNVIESVEIDDKEADFQKEKIIFNDKLNCIIGGKSTGKSLLLQNIATAIDRKQVEDKLDKNFDKRRFLSGVIVNWADGSKSLISNKQEQEHTHKIVYIPQTYLNRLTDKQQEQTEIDKIIKEILLQNRGFVEKDIRFNTLRKEQNQKLSKILFDLLQKSNTLIEYKQKLLELGTLEGISNEIKKLEDDKQKLSNNISLKKDELLKYDENFQEYKSNQRELEKNNNILGKIQSLTRLVEKVEVPYFTDSNIREQILNIQIKIIKEAEKLWIEEKEKIEEALKKSNESINSKNIELESYLELMKEKISSNNILLNITEKIQRQKLKLDKYNNIVNEVKTLNDECSELKEQVIEDILYYKSIHDDYANNSILTTDENALNFSIETVLKADSFKDFLRKSLDRRFMKALNEKLNFDIDNDEINNISFNRDMLRKILDLALSDELHLIKNMGTEIFLKELLQDWYESLYRITMDDDSIKDMSPGKKAIVLLQLLIQMADSTCPILIDQPEDDLDNRSIFKDLIPFIKKKKLDRQFIVVTHNANIVLGGDAEEVIVANRNGTKTPNEHYRFEYLTGSIENNLAADEKSEYVLPQKSIQGHICEIMEGGQEAFNLRKHKYNM